MAVCARVVGNHEAADDGFLLTLAFPHRCVDGRWYCSDRFGTTAAEFMSSAHLAIDAMIFERGPADRARALAAGLHDMPGRLVLYRAMGAGDSAPEAASDGKRVKTYHRVQVLLAVVSPDSKATSFARWAFKVFGWPGFLESLGEPGDRPGWLRKTPCAHGHGWASPGPKNAVSAADEVFNACAHLHKLVARVRADGVTWALAAERHQLDDTDRPGWPDFLSRLRDHLDGGVYDPATDGDGDNDAAGAAAAHPYPTKSSLAEASPDLCAFKQRLMLLGPAAAVDHLSGAAWDLLEPHADGGAPMPRGKLEAAALLVLANLGGKITRSRTAQKALLHDARSEADNPRVIAFPRPAGGNPAESLHLVLVRATWTMLVNLGDTSPVLLTVGLRLTASDTAGAAGLAMAAVPGVHDRDGVVHFPAGWAHVTAVSPEDGQVIAIVCSVDGMHCVGVSTDADDWRSVVLRPIGFWVTVDKQECKSRPMIGFMGRRAEAALIAATSGLVCEPGQRGIPVFVDYGRARSTCSRVLLNLMAWDTVNPLGVDPTGEAYGDKPLRAFHSVVYAAWDAFVAAYPVADARLEAMATAIEKDTLPSAVVEQLAASRHSEVAEMSRQLILHHTDDVEWTEYWWLTRDGTAAGGMVGLLVSYCQRVFEAAAADLPAGTPLATVAAAATRDTDRGLPVQPTGPSELGMSPHLIAFGASRTQAGRRELQVIATCAAGPVAGRLSGVARYGDPDTPGTVTWSATALALALLQPAAELSYVPDRATNEAAARQARADRRAVAADADAARVQAEAARVRDAEVAAADAARRDAAAAETAARAAAAARLANMANMALWGPAGSCALPRPPEPWADEHPRYTVGRVRVRSTTNVGLTKAVFPQVNGRSVMTVQRKDGRCAACGSHLAVGLSLIVAPPQGGDGWICSRCFVGLTSAELAATLRPPTGWAPF